MKRSEALRQKAAQSIKFARDLIDAADKEGRELSAEEQQSYSKHAADASRLIKDAQDADELDAAEERLAFDRQAAADRSASNARRVKIPGSGAAGDVGAASAEDKLCRESFGRYLRGQTLTEEQRFAVTTENGGQYVLPKYISPKWVATVAANNGLWEACDVTDSFEALTVGIPIITGFGDAQPVADDDTDTAEDDTSFDIGEAVLKAIYHSIPIKLSLMQREFSNLDAILTQEAAIAFGNSYEKQMVVGSGTGESTGLFVDSGVTAYAGANTTTGLSADTIRAARFQLLAAYARNARWLVSRSFMEKVFALKTDLGFLFDSEKQTLDGMPYHISEHVPHTWTAGQDVAALGDFFNLKVIADPRPAVELVTDTALAKKNQVMYIYRAKFACKIARPAAFKKIRLAAAG